MDVTVGPLVRLWHFGGSRVEGRERGAGERKGRAAAEAEIGAVREQVGYAKLESRAEPPALTKAVDGVEVDLSSIASGYTIDALADLLKRRGIKNFMVELGGEIRAVGNARGRQALASGD